MIYFGQHIMFSFRQKIFISYTAVFLVILVLLFPFALHTAKNIVRQAMRDRAQELIQKLDSAPDNAALVEMIKNQKALIFFRVSVITDEHKALYDSHIKRLLGERFSPEYVVDLADYPEVQQAFLNGFGYHEDYSKLLAQKLVYMAIAFDFHGKNYVLRTAFPYQYVVEMTHDFQIGFLELATIVLLLFSVMTWFIINHLTKPIQQIITAVKPYQDNLQSSLPEIQLKSVSPSDDFGKLAHTFNSLSQKVKKQIHSLTFERNEKETILESLVEGVVAIDENMIVTYANHAALKLLGMDSENLIGQSFSSAQEYKCYALLISCCKEKKPLSDILHIKIKGQKLSLEVVAAPKKDNSGAILVLQDKTAHYKMLEMHKDFIANASHELKTPITIIQGFAESLHDNPDLPRDTRVEITAKIERNCRRMGALIKNLLALSDVEKLPYSRLMECDLCAIIQNCCSILKDAYGDAHIQIQIPSQKEMAVEADPHLIEMAFMNLIENAAKYSQAPAQINIALDHLGEWIKVSITDQGIGIPAADLEHIFQRFYTVDKTRSRKLGGSGLGLSIVETIIEKHSGKISVSSELGQGTTFTVMLPPPSSG